MTEEMDLLNEAENAVEKEIEYPVWGEVVCTVFEAFRSSWAERNPIAFDKNIHPMSKRAVRIEITIIPLDEMGAKHNTERKFWADSREWASVTLPTLKAIGLPVANLNGAKVKVVQRNNGKTYEKKDKQTGLPTGELGKLSDFLFLKSFQSQDECLADYLTDGAEPSAASANDFPVIDTPAPAPTTNQAPDSLLIKFAEALVKTAVAQHGKDLLKVTEMVGMQISANKMYDGRFTVDSPEIQAVIVTGVA